MLWEQKRNIKHFWGTEEVWYLLSRGFKFRSKIVQESRGIEKNRIIVAFPSANVCEDNEFVHSERMITSAHVIVHRHCFAISLFTSLTQSVFSTLVQSQRV